MDDSDNNIPPDEDGPQQTPVRTASSRGENSNTDSSPSSRSEESVASNTVRSDASTNPGTPSSNGSLYDQYYVQHDALRLYQGDPDTDEDLSEVPQGSTEHKQMREGVNAAMCILSRTQTRDVMATYSIGVVEHMESNHGRSTAGNLKVYDDGTQNAISKWLEKLRGEFPDIYINPSIGSCYGSTERFLWGDHIDDYPPRSATRISIHPGVCSRMLLNLHLGC